MGRNIVGNLKFKKVQDGGFDHNKFAEMMEEAYASGEKRDSFITKTTFSPSTIGYGHGNCARYWFIAFTGAEFEEQFDAMARANMDNGTLAHDRIQKAMAKTGTLKDTEIEIRHDDPPIRGFADAIIEWQGKDVIGEIKTAKEEVFAVRQANMAPSGNHLLQLLAYMYIKKIDDGFFFYENKNDQSFLVLPVTMNERNTKIIEDAFDWLRSARKAYEDGTLPMRGFTKSKSACVYCPVKKVCWKEMEEGVLDIPSMVPPK